MPFKAKNNREAVVVCAIHVVKRPSKRSVLVYINSIKIISAQMVLKVLCLYLRGLLKYSV